MMLLHPIADYHGGKVSQMPSLKKAPPVFIAADKKRAELRNEVQHWSRSKKLAAFSRGGARVQQAFRKCPRSMWTYTAKKDNWCVNEVLWHLADQEANVYLRLRTALAENGPAVIAWDHSKWAIATLYSKADPQQALGLIQILRKANADLIKRIGPKAWTKRFKHPEFGARTVEYTVGMNIWHVEHHIGQMGRRLREWKGR